MKFFMLIILFNITVLANEKEVAEDCEPGLENEKSVKDFKSFHNNMLTQMCGAAKVKDKYKYTDKDGILPISYSSYAQFQSEFLALKESSSEYIDYEDFKNKYRNKEKEKMMQVAKSDEFTKLIKETDECAALVSNLRRDLNSKVHQIEFSIEKSANPITSLVNKKAMRSTEVEIKGLAEATFKQSSIESAALHEATNEHPYLTDINGLKYALLKYHSHAVDASDPNLINLNSNFFKKKSKATNLNKYACLSDKAKVKVLCQNFIAACNGEIEDVSLWGEEEYLDRDNLRKFFVEVQDLFKVEVKSQNIDLESLSNTKKFSVKEIEELMGKEMFNELYPTDKAKKSFLTYFNSRSDSYKNEVLEFFKFMKKNEFGIGVNEYKSLMMEVVVLSRVSESNQTEVDDKGPNSIKNQADAISLIRAFKQKMISSKDPKHTAKKLVLLVKNMRKANTNKLSLSLRIGASQSMGIGKALCQREIN